MCCGSFCCGGIGTGCGTHGPICCGAFADPGSGPNIVGTSCPGAKYGLLYGLLAGTLVM